MLETDASMTQSRLWPDILESLLQAAWEKPSRKTEIREDVLGALSCVLDGLSGLTKNPTTLQIFSGTAHAVLKSFAGDEVVLTMLGVKCLEEGLYRQAQYFLQVGPGNKFVAVFRVVNVKSLNSKLCGIIFFVSWPDLKFCVA